MMSGGVRDVEIPVCNVDLSTRTSCVHDLVTFWASHADLSTKPYGPISPPLYRSPMDGRYTTRFRAAFARLRAAFAPPKCYTYM